MNSDATQSLTIQGHIFAVPSPYEEGDTLSAAEAKALNGLLGENLRNNFAKQVKAAIDASERAEAPEPFDIEALKTALALYADEYEFQGKRSPRAPKDPILAEATKMAKTKISERIRELGKKVSDYAEGQFDAAVAKYAAREDVLAEAKRRVESMRSNGTAGLEELGL